MPIITIEALHVSRQRMGVHRELWMCVRSQKLGTFHADGSIAESGPFGGASNDADVVGHDLSVRYLLWQAFVEKHFATRTLCSLGITNVPSLAVELGTPTPIAIRIISVASIEPQL
jgi:hypothetical protein